MDLKNFHCGKARFSVHTKFVWLIIHILQKSRFPALPLESERAACLHNNVVHSNVFPGGGVHIPEVALVSTSVPRPTHPLCIVFCGEKLFRASSGPTLFQKSHFKRIILTLNLCGWVFRRQSNILRTNHDIFDVNCISCISQIEAHILYTFKAVLKCVSFVYFYLILVAFL